MPALSVTAMTVSTLKELVPGGVVAPGDPEWDAARRFHSGIGEPTVVVRASSVDDVRAAPALRRPPSGSTSWCAAAATARGAPCRAGSRSISRRSTTSTSTARSCASAAARRGAQSRATLADHGLGVSSGDTASVGVGGLTLGGGIGWMVRAWGLAADQLVGAQLVTARGAGARGDRGVASRAAAGRCAAAAATSASSPASTSAPTSCAAVVFATLGVTGDARPVLRALRDTLQDAPRELTVTFMDVPRDGPERARPGRRSRRAGSATTRRPRVRRSRRSSRSTA